MRKKAFFYIWPRINKESVLCVHLDGQKILVPKSKVQDSDNVVLSSVRTGHRFSRDMENTFYKDFYLFRII